MMPELKLIAFSLSLPLLLVLFGFVFKNKLKKIAFLCFGLGFIAVYLPLTGLFVTPLMNNWQSIPPISNNQISENKPQVIVILTGAYEGTLVEYPEERNVSSVSLMRGRYGAELSRRFQLPVAVLGGFVDAVQKYSLADSMSNVLEQEFLVEVAYKEGNSRTTAENASNAAGMLKAEGISSVILVTDAMHMPRAALAFQRYGFTVTPAPTSFIHSRVTDFRFKLIPQGRYWVQFKQFLHEKIGYHVYDLYTLPKEAS